MVKLKPILAGLCCMTMMVSVAACGGGADSGKSVVEFMTMQASGTPQLKAIEGLTAKFEEANPDVSVKLLPGTNNNENDIKVRLAGHNAPDIWATHGWSRDRYGNFLEPLQNRSWANRLKSIGDDVFKDKEGNFYALPVDIQVSGIMYNKTVLDQVGVDPASLTTWDSFTQACEKVREAGITPIISSPKDLGPDGDLADYILPGLYAKDDLDNLSKGEFDVDVYRQYTEMIKDWVDAGYFNVDYTSASIDDISREMASNRVAFGFRANGNAQLMESFNPDVKLGMIPVPSKTGERYFSIGEDVAFGVSRDSKNKEAALRYLVFLAEPENMEVLVETCLNDSALEGVDSALGQFQDTYDHWVREEQTMTVPFFDRAYLPSGMYTTLSKSTDGLITGQLTPQAAAEQVKTAFDSLYGQNS